MKPEFSKASITISFGIVRSLFGQNIYTYFWVIERRGAEAGAGAGSEAGEGVGVEVG